MLKDNVVTCYEIENSGVSVKFKQDNEVLKGATLQYIVSVTDEEMIALEQEKWALEVRNILIHG